MKRFFAIVLCLFLLAAISGSVFGAGGDTSDPVISLSYLNGTLKPQLQEACCNSAVRTLTQAHAERFRALADAVAAYNLSCEQSVPTALFRQGRVTLKQGDRLSLSVGCKATLLSGHVQTNTTTLVNVTTGEVMGNKTVLRKGETTMQSGTADGITVSSATAELFVSGVCTRYATSAVDYGSMANSLSTMGLFRGTGEGYDLESGASRVQGLVMFLRLLGLEDEALVSTGTHPFVDVPQGSWAYPYVAYAYAHKLTNGVSEASFSPNSAISAQQYMTFLMRALHYTEGSDFSYNAVLTDCVSRGLFRELEIASLSSGAFSRAKMVYLSYCSLFFVDQERACMLLDALKQDGAINEATLYRGLCQVFGGRIS